MRIFVLRTQKQCGSSLPETIAYHICFALFSAPTTRIFLFHSYLHNFLYMIVLCSIFFSLSFSLQYYAFHFSFAPHGICPFKCINMAAWVNYDCNIAILMVATVVTFYPRRPTSILFRLALHSFGNFSYVHISKCYRYSLYVTHTHTHTTHTREKQRADENKKIINREYIFCVCAQATRIFTQINYVFCGCSAL